MVENSIKTAEELREHVLDIGLFILKRVLKLKAARQFGNTALLYIVVSHGLCELKRCAAAMRWRVGGMRKVVSLCDVSRQ